MKKLILIIAAIAFFTACSKKQDAKPLTPQTTTAKDLAGTWALVSTTDYITSGSKTDTITSTNSQGINFQFKTDGTGVENLITFVVNFTYTVSNGTIFEHEPATDNSAAQDLNITITAITTTKMVLRIVAPDDTQVLSFVKN